MAKGKRYKTNPKRRITNIKRAKGSKHVLATRKSSKSIRNRKQNIRFIPRQIYYMIGFLMLMILSLNFVFAYFRANEQKTNRFNIQGSYTVIFDANTGTGLMQNQEILPWLPTNLKSNSFAKAGYSFCNWNTEPNGSGATYADEQSVTNLGNITLYAQWAINTYNITYTLNDGTVSANNPDTYNIETNDITLNNPTKTGYFFKGWSGTDLTGDTNTAVTIAHGSTGDREYTANYIANTYYIKFNSNGGSGSMLNQTMTYDTAANINECSFTKSGYVLAGWNTQADGNGTSYANGQLVSNLTATNGGVINLYAQWAEPIKYAVQIYGINQDEDASGNKLGLTFGPAVGANYNNSYVTHEYEETSSGSEIYNVKIVTHNVAANGTETTTSEYLKDSSDNNVTRTATQKSKYDVNIHDMTWAQIKNKSTTDPSVFTDCMLCGDTKSVELALNSTIKTANTYNQYGDGAGMLYYSIKNTTGAYYRIWNPNKTQNSYVGTDVTLSSDEESYGSNARNAGGYSSSHIRATLVGKDFKTNEGYAGDVNLTENTCVYSCIEEGLQAVITPKKVKYVTGTGSSDYDLNEDISDKIWFFSDREMYGHGNFSGITAEGLRASGVGYSKFGNTNSKYYISSYNGDANTNRVAYTESGTANNWWIRSPNLDSTDKPRFIRYTGSFSQDSAYHDAGLTFGFCIEGAGSYKVKYNANGGTGTMADQSIAVGAKENLTANTFTKSGYSFAGWNTKTDGTGITYANSAEVENLAAKNETINLYAQWITPVKYAVQIYGINQDQDASGNTLGLTFGPAIGANYRNSYVTHEYEEITENPGNYYVKIVTHQVAENGEETRSEAYLTDSSSNNVTRTTEEKNLYDINMHEMTWAQIAAVSDKTKFTDCMLCGDTKSVSLTLNSTIKTTSTYTQYGDGAGMLYNTINSYYRRWNPNKSQNSYVGTDVTLDSNEENYGSNARNAGGYSSSHIRATLIGKNAKTNEGYAGNVNLSSDTCLYSCIEDDLQQVITPKKIRYVTGTSENNYTLNDDIEDSIWLFSAREVYGTGSLSGGETEGIGNSGVGYAKFSDSKSRYYIASYTTGTDQQKKTCWDDSGSVSSWWLRSPYLVDTRSVGRVSDDDGFTSVVGEDPFEDHGLSFGFCIK